MVVFTNVDGQAMFNDLHSKGIWAANVQGTNGYNAAVYNIDTNSTTETAINRGQGIITLSLISGSNNVPVYQNQVVYKAVLSGATPQNYSVNILGVPSTVSYTVSTSNGLGTIANNGDYATITFYFNMGQTNYGGNLIPFSFYVKGTSTNYNIESNQESIEQDWTVTIQAVAQCNITVTALTGGQMYENYSINNFSFNITGTEIPVGIYAVVTGTGSVTGNTYSFDSVTATAVSTNNFYVGATETSTDMGQSEPLSESVYVDLLFYDSSGSPVIKERFISPSISTLTSTSATTRCSVGTVAQGCTISIISWPANTLPLSCGECNYNGGIMTALVYPDNGYGNNVAYITGTPIQ
jgi:hypothetical protein